MAIKISGSTIIDDSRQIINSSNVGIGTTNPTAAVTSANTGKIAVGIISAYEIWGNGENITGIIGDKVSGITIKDEGSTVGTAGSVGSINFVGPGVTATATGAGSTITIPGFGPDSQYNLYAGTCVGAASDADTCYNVGLGYSAAVSLNSGDRNVIIGYCAGNAATSATNSVILGYNAGKILTNTEHSIIIGNCAGYNANVKDDNIYIGRVAGGAIAKKILNGVRFPPITHIKSLPPGSLDIIR